MATSTHTCQLSDQWPKEEDSNSSKPLQSEDEKPLVDQPEKSIRKTRLYNRVQNDVRKELVDRVYTGGESIYKVRYLRSC